MILKGLTIIGGKTIRRQLVTGVMLVFLAVMTAFVTYLLSAQRHFLLDKARSHALIRTELLAASCRQSVMSHDITNLQEVVQSMHGDSSMCHAMIIDLGGRVLAHSDPRRVGQVLTDATSKKLLQHEGKLDCTQCHTADEIRRHSMSRDTCSAILSETPQTLEIAVPISGTNGPIAWARLARDLSDDNAHLRRIIEAAALFTLAALCFGTLVVSLMAGAVLRPLRILLRGTELLAENRLDQRLAVTAENEIGTVAKAFNNALDRLDRQTGERRRAEEDLARQVRQIQESATVLSASTASIFESVQRLARNATDAAVAVTEVTTSVEEVRHVTQMATKKATDVSARAQKAADISAIGRHSTEENVVAMNRIRQQMESIAGSMTHLSEQTQTIGQIITTADEIAAQSNLLAVNAAIEAAKAGEQGRGFAVVAQEIKNLAEQSKQATRQVRGILGDIQKATGAAVMATEQGSKAVESGVRQSSQAGESILTLAQGVGESAQAAVEIAASSQQQLIGADHVAAAMMSIKNLTAQNVASMTQLEMAAHDLNELGQRLKDLVERHETGQQQQRGESR